MLAGNQLAVVLSAGFQVCSPSLRQRLHKAVLTITSPLASKRECSANSELVPPPGSALEQHRFRRFSTAEKRSRHQTGSESREPTPILEPEVPVSEASLTHLAPHKCQYLVVGGPGFPAQATASTPAWPCVCPEPGRRHLAVLGSLLGISSQC